MTDPPTNEREVLGEYAPEKTNMRLPNPEEILRGRLIMTRGFGLDPVAEEQAIFNYFWDKMPHLITPLSNKVRGDVNAEIETIVNKLLSQ
jgi:hypothetical protein